jgi:hypothetical protein
MVRSTRAATSSWSCPPGCRRRHVRCAPGGGVDAVASSADAAATPCNPEKRTMYARNNGAGRTPSDAAVGTGTSAWKTHPPGSPALPIASLCRMPRQCHVPACTEILTQYQEQSALHIRKLSWSTFSRNRSQPPSCLMRDKETLRTAHQRLQNPATWRRRQRVPAADSRTSSVSFASR